MHSERVRKRVLRLKRYVAEMKAAAPDNPKIKSFEAELSRLITGKRPSRPVGATVGVKPARRRK